MTTTPPKQSDLGVRAASAVVMIAVAGTALWLGGWVWTAFVALVALGVLWEWWGLVRRFSNSSGSSQRHWIAGGVGYVGFAASTLVVLRSAAADSNCVGRSWPSLLPWISGPTFAGPHHRRPENCAER